MPQFRYVVAVVVACLIIAAGAAFCRHTRQSFVDRFRRSMQEAKALGTLPPELKDADLETITPEGWAVETTRGEVVRIRIADLLAGWWFLWIPLVFGVCLGVASLVGRTQGEPS